MSRVCSFCGAVIDASMSECKKCGAPNDGYVAQSSSSHTASLNAPLPGESQIRGFGDRLVQSWGLGKTGAAPGFLELLVRAFFLDGDAYRQAAADKNGNGLAVVALLLPILAGSIGGVLLHLGSYVLGLDTLQLIVNIVFTLIATVAAIGVMAAFSQAVLHTRLSFGELFRALAYAQSPGVLAIIPVLGTLFSLWRLATSVVAIREISGADLLKSGILFLIGVVTMIILSAVVAAQIIRAVFF